MTDLQFIVAFIVIILGFLFAGYLMECNEKIFDEGFNVNLRGFGNPDWILLNQEFIEECKKMKRGQ